ncbi:MAG: STAS domain-containing protein [Chloroflexi bacterium]|nr:STAS domain-containing protein [Chloroflexota bacterium]MBI3167444.1 STAS domain-containing protein [Chloroflexota bacterium]
MDKLSIQTEAKGGATIVTVSGRVDSETAPMLDAELTKAADGSSKLVLDLKGVDYMSSAGIRAVVKASQAVEQKGGGVKLASVPESVQSLLYTVGLNQKIGAYASTDEAVASF